MTRYGCGGNVLKCPAALIQSYVWARFRHSSRFKIFGKLSNHLSLCAPRRTANWGTDIWLKTKNWHITHFRSGQHQDITSHHKGHRAPSFSSHTAYSGISLSAYIFSQADSSAYCHLTKPPFSQTLHFCIPVSGHSYSFLEAPEDTFRVRRLVRLLSVSQISVLVFFNM